MVINLDNYYRQELHQFFNTFSAMFVIMLVSVMLTKNQHYIMCNTKPSGAGGHEKNTSRDLVKCTFLIWKFFKLCEHYIKPNIHWKHTPLSSQLTFSIALLSLPVILLQTLAANALDAKGSSLITVFRPMLEISRSCSFSETMFPQRASTIVSTWYSFTLFTSGPKLQ